MPARRPPILLPALLAVLALAALWMAAVRGWADFRIRSASQLPDLERACQLDPARADCLARLARLREQMALDASREWERLLALHPRQASYLTEAALAAEFRGDLSAAERLLLQAARYNQLWLPRWSLANFYFRHGRPEEFRRWARLAFERAYGDRTALFRLCREAGVSGGELTAWLAGNRDNLAALVSFLSAAGPARELPPAIERYLETAGPAEAPVAQQTVNAAINVLLREGSAAAIPPLWNRMAERRLIPYPAWSEDAPLVNPGFLPPLPGGGLDWRLPSAPGVECFPGAPPGGVKFTFSGGQPEAVVLLEQWLVLPGGRAWILEFEYQTPGIPPGGSHLVWSLEGLPAAEAPALAAAVDWTRFQARWEAPPGLPVRRLVLRAERPRGQARHEGELRIRALRFTPEARP